MVICREKNGAGTNSFVCCLFRNKNELCSIEKNNKKKHEYLGIPLDDKLTMNYYVDIWNVEKGKCKDRNSY